MSFSSEIRAKISLDTGGFASGLVTAGARLNEFVGRAQREAKSLAGSWEGLRKVFLAGGLLTAVKGFFDTAIEYARKYEGAADESVQATVRLGNTFDEIKETGARAGVAIVGWIEKASLGLAGLVYGADAAADAFDSMNAAASGGADEKAVKARLAAEAELAKVRRDVAMSEGDANQKLVILLNEQLDLRSKLRGLQEGSVEWLQTTAALEKKSAEVRKADAESLADADRRRRDMEKKSLEEIAAAEETRSKRLEELAAKREKLVVLAQAEAAVEAEMGRITAARASGASGVNASDLDFDFQRDSQGNLVLDAKGRPQPTNIRSKRGGVGGGSFDRGAMLLLGGERTFNDPAAQLAYEKTYKSQTLDKINAEIAQLEREYQDTQRRAAFGGQTRTYMAPLLLDRITALRSRRANVDGYLFDPNYADGAGRSIPGQQIEAMGGAFENYAKSTAKSLDDIRRILTDKGINVRNLPPSLTIPGGG